MDHIVARTRTVRSTVLAADGAFLAATGATVATFELLSYVAGAGPLGDAFRQPPYTIGWFENHGLACLVGLLLLVVARRDPQPYWHAFGLAIHALLGTANVVFWDGFGHFDIVGIGVATTVAHVVFVAAHAACLHTARRPVPERL